MHYAMLFELADLKQRRRHETEFKARWVPLLPRESAKKTFNVGDDRCLNDMRCFRGGLTLGVHKIPFRVFSSIGPGHGGGFCPACGRKRGCPTFQRSRCMGFELSCG